MNINPLTSDIREEKHGRTLTDLRWHQGRLQAGYTSKVTRYEGRRLLDSGTRLEWQDVPGEIPVMRLEDVESPAPQPTEPTGREVARLRLPIAVEALSGIVDTMATQYGKGLTLRQVETWLVFERPDSTKPNTQAQAPRREQTPNPVESHE